MNSNFDVMFRQNRGVGDVRPSTLYRKPLNPDDVQELSNMVCQWVLELPEDDWPEVRLSGMYTTRLGGKACRKGCAGNNVPYIIVHHESWGVLAHELAHFPKGSKHHNGTFRYWHQEILNFMEDWPIV